MYKTPVIAVFIREVDRIAKRTSTRNLLIWVPVLIFFFLASIYIQGGLKEIPVAVYDADNSSLSRKIVSYLEVSKSLHIVKYLNSSHEVENVFLDDNSIHGVFVIPKDIQKDVLKGKQTTLSVFTNSSNIVYGNILKKEAFTIVTTVSSGALLRRFKAAGMTSDKAMSLVMPITVHTDALYNPYYNYLYYLIPGLLTVLLQMIIFFVATRAINSEFSEGTFSELFDISGQSPITILLGKALAYTLFGMVISIFIVGVVFQIFQIPVYGDMTRLFLLFLLFVVVNVFLGFLLSVIFEDQILSLDIAFFYNSPAFVFSGFTFPKFGMPAFDQFYAQLIPYTHFLGSFFKIYQMDVSTVYLKNDIYALLIFLAIGLSGSYSILKIKVSKFLELNILQKE